MIAVVTPGNVSGFPQLMLVDGSTNQAVDAPPIPQSSVQSINGQWAAGYSRTGPPMIDPDGTINLLVEVRQVAYPNTLVTGTLQLMRITPGGAASTTPIVTIATNANLFPGRIIPDGQGGHVVTWIYSPFDPPADPSPFRAAHVGASVTLFNLPILPAVATFNAGVPVHPELVLGEGDRMFATYGAGLVAFSKTTGVVHWRYDAAGPISIVSQTEGNGLVAKVSGGGAANLLNFDIWGANETVPTPPLASLIVAQSSTGMLAVVPDGFSTYQAAVRMNPSSYWSSPTMGGTLQAALTIYVSDPQNSLGVPPATTPQDVIRGVMTKLKAALEQESPTMDPFCRGWLVGNGTTGVAYLNAMLQGNAFGHAMFRSGLAPTSPAMNDKVAFRGGKNPGSPVDDVGVPVGWILTFNRGGAFFQPNVYVGSRLVRADVGPQGYPGGTLSAQAFTIIHELGHLVQAAGFQADFGINEKNGPVNDLLVDGFCRVLIEGLQP